MNPFGHHSGVVRVTAFILFGCNSVVMALSVWFFMMTHGRDWIWIGLLNGVAVAYSMRDYVRWRRWRAEIDAYRRRYFNGVEPPSGLDG